MRHYLELTTGPIFGPGTWSGRWGFQDCRTPLQPVRQSVVPPASVSELVYSDPVPDNPLPDLPVPPDLQPAEPPVFSRRTSSQPVYSHRLGPQDARDLGREVLLTDGLGGFALSSPAGVPTRCYSGLAQSLRPPVQRQTMFISALETLEVAGRAHTLHAYEVAPGTLEGDGLNLLSHVDLNDLLPTRV